MTRRSSRARTSQPSPALLQHTNSSSSSTSLNRGERNTRSNHKIFSPRRSSTQRSQSTEDADGSKNDFPHTRQRQRARGEDEQDQDINKEGGEEEEEDGDEEEEEEVTRCLCGQQEYPGLPPSRREALGRSGLPASRPKDEAGLNGPPDSSDLMSDDIGSMFIQCDTCKVWQHGGCVGIMDEAMSPDEYFCEECRKDLHKVRSEPNHQHSSTYLPVAPPSPAPSSRASSRDNSKRTKDKHHNDPNNVKRRSTMNSRDAAYDEEEQLRRAIEESKEDTKSSPEAATRRGKRSRSDSEAQRQVTKRPRTSSPSPAAASKSNPNSQPASDNEAKTKPTTNETKKRAVSRSQREKEARDPEETEPERPETATRKKGKTERKGQESDQEIDSPTKNVANEPEQTQPSPETPAPVQEPAPSRPSTRKSGRPARRGARLGRNQYTRDRDTNGAELNSPRRGQSHDTNGDSPRVGGSNGTHVNGTDLGKPSKPRYINPQRTTMLDMKRRVAGILEFISRMQVEMAVTGESSPINGDPSHGALLRTVADQLEGMIPSNSSDGGESVPATDGESSIAQPQKERDFKDLSSFEMMDVLTRHLLKWQQEYGKTGGER